MITIAVIGVLAAGIVTVLNPRRQLQRAWDAERKNTLLQLRVLLEDYYNDNNAYPDTGNVTFSSEDNDEAGNYNSGVWIPGLAPDYIRELPRDPEGGDSERCTGHVAPTTKRAYLYRSTGQEYTLLSHCSMAPGVTWSSSYGLYDDTRPNWAWKVCVGAGCGL